MVMTPRVSNATPRLSRQVADRRPAAIAGSWCHLRNNQNRVRIGKAIFQFAYRVEKSHFRPFQPPGQCPGCPALQRAQGLKNSGMLYGSDFLVADTGPGKGRNACLLGNSGAVNAIRLYIIVFLLLSCFIELF
ncbi:hypothetical protein D3C86_1696520 [compost metagenome]